MADHEQIEEKTPALLAATSSSNSNSASVEVTSLSSSASRGRTNSERGRAFRERQWRYECELELSITKLKKEIHNLHVARELKQECALQTRQSMDGSLTKIVREYQRVFEHGIPEPEYGPRGKEHLSYWGDSPTHMFKMQQEFVRCVVHPDIKIGMQSGIDALNETWRRYTKYHHNFRMEAGALEILGTAEDPIVIADGFLHTRYSRDTFRYLFPHVAHDEVLMAKFIAREVSYPFRNLFYFTREGLICQSDLDVQFVEALVNAGGSLEDVAKLMGQALIADQYVIGPAEDDDEADGRGEVQDESRSSAEELKGGDAASHEQDNTGDTGEDLMHERECNSATSALPEPEQLQSDDLRETELERHKLDLAFILSTDKQAESDA